MKSTNFKYAAIIPLAGGFTIGTLNTIGKPPEVIFSYKVFESNDILLRRFLEKRGHDVPYYQLDNLSPSEELDIIEKYKNKLDFVHGIPPCSGLSMAAQRKAGSRGTAPPNDWMYDSATWVLNNIQPTIYAFENAPGLYTGSGDEVRERLIKIGQLAGYSITFYKTNTLKHGVPQFRPRTFALFYKGPYAPILHSYNKPALHISEYLEQIPKDATLQNAYMTKDWDITQYEIYKYFKMKFGDNWRKELTDHRPHLCSYDYLQRVKLFDEFQEFQKNLPDDERSEIVTKNIAHIKKNREEGRGARINYRIIGIDKDYPYAVIGEMMTREIHPIEDRLMNIREFMHLMGLPHDYDLNSEGEYVKISQNVPVCTCSDITTEIVEIINGNRAFSSKSVYMQDNTKEIETGKTKSLF